MLETISKIQPLISMVISLATLIGFVIIVYKFSAEPDQKNKGNLEILKASCVLKHTNLDKTIYDIKENFSKFEKNFTLLKDNHIAHIERDMNEMKITQARILAIMETKEKYDKKQ